MNFDSDWPIILSSTDKKLIEYNEVVEIQNENKFLTAGLFFMFVTATILIVHLNRSKQSKENTNQHFIPFDY